MCPIHSSLWPSGTAGTLLECVSCHQYQLVYGLFWAPIRGNWSGIHVRLSLASFRLPRTLRLCSPCQSEVTQIPLFCLVWHRCDFFHNGVNAQIRSFQIKSEPLLYVVLDQYISDLMSGHRFVHVNNVTFLHKCEPSCYKDQIWAKKSGLSSGW